MKIFKKSYLGLLLTICIVSCKKDKKDDMPSPVNSIVSSSTLAKLKQYGTIINEGTTPPDITGAFLMTPNVCTFDNSSSGFEGALFDDYLYKFSKQDNKAFTVKVNFYSFDNEGDDTGSDNEATFISGKNNLFTVYSKATGTAYGINYTTLEIVSGEITSTGIKNLQITKYLQSKDEDPIPVLTEVGTTRIFYDSDKLSEKQEGTQLSLIKKPVQLKSVAVPSHLGSGVVR